MVILYASTFPVSWFSKQHRDLNVRRIGFVASEITKMAGVAICGADCPLYGYTFVPSGKWIGTWRIHRKSYCNVN